MAKKDLGKIIAIGSIKQRLLLNAENVARGKYFQERLLTDHEANQLLESFKKPNEIRLWNEFRRIDESVTSSIVNLISLHLQVLHNHSRLLGFVYLLNAIKDTEQVANSILRSIKDEQERKRIAVNAIKGVEFFGSNKKVDSEGYVVIDVTNIDNYHEEDFLSLRRMITDNKDATILAVQRYLSWEKAILDYMDETGFNVATYKYVVKQMTKQVIYLTKGYGEIGEGLLAMPEIRVDEQEYDKVKRYYLQAEEYPEPLRNSENQKFQYE